MSTTLLELVLPALWLSSAVAASGIAYRKHRWAKAWLCLGLVIGVFAVPIVLCLRPLDQRPSAQAG